MITVVVIVKGMMSHTRADVTSTRPITGSLSGAGPPSA